MFIDEGCTHNNESENSHQFKVDVHFKCMGDAVT